MYVAFDIDAYARRILGWATAMTMTTDFVLHALEQSVWTRRRDGHGDFTGLINHHDKDSQYASIRHGQALAEAGIADSAGSTGDSYVDEVEIATVEWVDWFNLRRLYQCCGDIPPAELEAECCARITTPQPELSTV